MLVLSLNRMKITAIKYYGGARGKIARVGLAHLFLELQHIILDTRILLVEEKDNNGAGVELQVSARSDLVVRDLVHLRNSLAESEIDAGVIIVPSDRMGRFLPDRTPTLRETIKYIEQEFKEAMATPLVIIAIEHDGPGK